MACFQTVRGALLLLQERLLSHFMTHDFVCIRGICSILFLFSYWPNACLLLLLEEWARLSLGLQEVLGSLLVRDVACYVVQQ